MPVLRLMFVCLAGLTLLSPSRASTQLPVRAMHVGDSAVWSYSDMTTAATGDPAVVDILPLSTHGLLVNAKGPGRTTIVVFDQQGRHAVQVVVAADMSRWPVVAARIQQDIGLPTVTVRAIKDVIFLEGVVATPLAAQRAESIAQVYAPTVHDLIQVAPGAAAAPLAETYATLINAAWTSRGVTAQVVDPQTIALSGIYTPLVQAPDDASAPEPPTTDDLVAEDDSARSEAAHNASHRGGQRAQGDDALTRLIASLPPSLHVVDLVQDGARPVQQVLVRAKVIDIDRNSLNQLGVQWGTLQLNDTHSGPDYSLAAQPILFGQSANNLYTSPLSGGPLKQFFPLAAALTALITENKARVLSEPSLLVKDGSEGSMLVGGEIPVPVAQSSNGLAGANVSVEYKPYGVRLQIQPTVVAPDTVELTATPEVSDLDYSNSVNFNGLSIPALTIRRATSTLQMHNGQTLVIGGLYSNSMQRQVQRIPLLSDIPVIGEFFKYTQSSKEESELLILLSVEIVAPDAPDVQPPAPGSPENPSIGKPDVAPNSFGSFPDIQNLGHANKDQPSAPVNLPDPVEGTP